VLGSTNINLSPAALRPGIRLSSSTSNRTYGGRIMVTYTQQETKGVSYSISASRRWANQGYIKGTAYDANSVFGALQYRINPKNSLQLTGIFAANTRGRSSAITQEVFELLGSNYNPYWGFQEGKIRNTRIRNIQEPIVLFNYNFSGDGFTFRTGVSYQWGKQSNSRLAYFNAPNPDPTYYRYLPSFYINSRFGANFTSAGQARDAFINDPQIAWEEVYRANQNTATAGASYIISNDVVSTRNFGVVGTAELNLSKQSKVQLGGQWRVQSADNYAEIGDLLQADFHFDIDPFSNKINSVGQDPTRLEGDKYAYNYKLEATQASSFVQFTTKANKWDAFVSGNYETTSYQRNGLFKNERFLDSSFGPSKTITFQNLSAKSGFTYHFTGRHKPQRE